MSSDLDKMLADLDEFNKMMESCGHKRKANSVAYRNANKHETTRRVEAVKEKPVKSKEHKNALSIFKRNWKTIGTNITLTAGTVIGGAAMLNSAPVAGLAVMVLGPEEVIRMKNGFMSGLKKFKDLKKENPNLSKMQRFRQSASFGMKKYIKSSIAEHKNKFKMLKNDIKKAAMPFQSAIMPISKADVLQSLNEKSRN